MRQFTIHKINNKTYASETGGRYKSTNPLTAAIKAFSLMLRNNNSPKISFTISIRETTKNSKHEIYTYKLTRVEKQNPVMLKLNNKNIVCKYEIVSNSKTPKTPNSYKINHELKKAQSTSKRTLTKTKKTKAQSTSKRTLTKTKKTKAQSTSKRTLTKTKKTKAQSTPTPTKKTKYPTSTELALIKPSPTSTELALIKPSPTSTELALIKPSPTSTELALIKPSPTSATKKYKCSQKEKEDKLTSVCCNKYNALNKRTYDSCKKHILTRRTN